MKIQENMTSPKQHNNPPITELKDMKICNLFNKEFKIIVLRKLNGLPENIDRQCNEIRKISHEENEKLNKDRIHKKNQILELKNSMNEIKNAIKRSNSRVDRAEPKSVS